MLVSLALPRTLQTVPIRGLGEARNLWHPLQHATVERNQLETPASSSFARRLQIAGRLKTRCMALSMQCRALAHSILSTSVSARSASMRRKGGRLRVYSVRQQTNRSFERFAALLQGKNEEEKKKFAEFFSECQKVVDSKQLRPMIRTQYMRTAFQARLYKPTPCDAPP